MYEEIIYSLKKTNSDKSRLCEKKEKKKRILRPEEKAFEKLHKHYLLSYKPNKLSSFNKLLLEFIFLFPVSFSQFEKRNLRKKIKTLFTSLG